MKTNSQSDPKTAEKSPEYLSQLSLSTDLAKKGHYDEAIVNLKALLNNHTGDEVATGLLAAIYMQIGMDERAIELYDSILVDNPNNPLVRFQKGMAHLRNGSPEDALSTWEPLLSNDEDFMTQFHAGAAFLQINDTERAKDSLQKAKKNIPANHPLAIEVENLLHKIS